MQVPSSALSLWLSLCRRRVSVDTAMLLNSSSLMTWVADNMTALELSEQSPKLTDSANWGACLAFWPVESSLEPLL